MLRDDFHILGYMYGSLVAHASEKWKHDKHIQVGTIQVDRIVLQLLLFGTENN